MPGNFSFRRRDRILREADYERVFAEARRYVGPFFVLFARPNDLGFPRLGMVVSQKNIKTAVQRNRIKRVIRESFRKGKAMLGSCDYVVLARPPAAEATNAELFSALQKQWQEVSSCVPFS